MKRVTQHPMEWPCSPLDLPIDPMNRRRPLIKQKRYEQIIDLVNTQRAVSIDEFCERLDVSKATIRRDLIFLDAHKQLRRTHGGAISLVKPAIEAAPLSLRHRMHKTEKERIATAAAQMITDGDTVYIGSGSTTQALAARLNVFSNLTIVTNDIAVAYGVSQNTQNRLIVTGGMLKPETATLIGAIAEGTLRDVQVRLAFMSANAVCAGGFMDQGTEEIAIKRMMLGTADRTIMLCDQSKFMQRGFMTICQLTDVELTITDSSPGPVLEQALRDAGLSLRVV